MKRFLKKSSKVLGFLGIAMILAGVFIILYQSYSVRNVYVTVLSGDIRNLVGVSDYYGKNLLLIKPKDVESDLKNQNPALQSISVIKQLPSTLKIRISARKPVAALQVSDNGVFIMDRDGVILLREQNYSGQVPALKYYQTFQYKQYQVGDKLDFKDLVTALYFVDELGGYGYPSQRIDINGQYMIRLSIIDKKAFFFTSEKERDVQMYQLKELLRQFKIQGKDFKTIDLRFDKPVITIR